MDVQKSCFSGVMFAVGNITVTQNMPIKASQKYTNKEKKILTVCIMQDSRI